MRSKTRPYFKYQCYLILHFQSVWNQSETYFKISHIIYLVCENTLRSDMHRCVINEIEHFSLSTHEELLVRETCACRMNKFVKARSLQWITTHLLQSFRKIYSQVEKKKYMTIFIEIFYSNCRTRKLFE